MTESARTAAERARAKGFHTVTPHLVCAGAVRAIEFYKEAFEAIELIRLSAPDGKLIYAQLSINGSSIMLVDELVMTVNDVADRGGYSPKALNGTPVTIHLMVEDVDAVVERAVKAGAKIAIPVADMFWGDQYGVIEDPFGHHWSIATPGEPMSQEDMQEAARKAMEAFADQQARLQAASAQ